MEKRFWSKISILEDEALCWEWRAFRNRDGYGRLTYGAEDWLAHRLAWILTKGEIPAGLGVLHRCDNPPCCNPSHLFLGDQLANAKDMKAKGRHSHGDTHHWHLRPETVRRGEGHSQGKLTEKAVIEIRLSYSTGRRTQQSLGDEFGVSREMIREVVLLRSWKHVPSTP